MKKVLVGVLLLLVVAGVGAPFVSGLVMEKIVRQSFDNLNTIYSETGSGVFIEILHYDRGFYSTEIEWKMKLGTLQSVYGVEQIIFIERAKHGFANIVSTTSLEKNKWFTDFVSKKLQGKNPLAITTEYTLAGQIHSAIALDAFSLPINGDGDGDIVQVKAGKALFECDKDLKEFNVESSWEGMTVSDKIRVDGISMVSNFEMISSTLWDGTLSFGIEKSTVQGNAEPFELADFKGDYTLDVDKEENVLSVVSTFGVAHLIAGQERVDDAFVRIGVINIDIPGFEEFIKLYANVANALFKDISEAEDDPAKMKTIFQEQLAQTQLQMMTAYERLLKKGLELQISDMHASLPAGEIKADAALSLNKDMTFAQFFPLMQQPNLFVDIFSLESDVSLPAKLVGDTPLLLSPIYSGMQTGLFVKQGEQLVNKIETRDGKLYLNGLEIVFN